MYAEIQLAHPVVNNGESINCLTLRRPKVRDRLIADKSAGDMQEKEICFLANLCEVTPSLIEELDLSDYIRLQETLNNFLS